MSPSPRVSIIMAAYNAEKYIDQSINSIRNQTLSDWELVVIDDCSSDNTQQVVEDFSRQDSRIVCRRLCKNIGPGAARNVAIAQARGDWMAIVDADDTIAPERLAKITARAEEQNADICFDNLMIVSDHAVSSLINAANAAKLSQPWTIENYTAFNQPYDSPVLIGFLKPLLRSQFLKDNGLKYNDELYNSEDYILILSSLIHGAHVCYLNDAMYNYTVRGSSLSGKFDPVAHAKLIAAESALADLHRSALSIKSQKAIKKHIESLRLAGATNAIFFALRNRSLSGLVRAVWMDKGHFLTHSKRVAKSAINKAFHIDNRGK